MFVDSVEDFLFSSCANVRKGAGRREGIDEGKRGMNVVDLFECIASKDIR